MLPYILLIVAAFICSFCAYIHTMGRAGRIVVGNTNYIKENNVCIPAFFLLLFIVMAIRDITVGADLLVYKDFFLDVKNMQFSDISIKDNDYLYMVLNWIIGRFTDNYQVFIAIVSALNLLPMCVQYARERRHAFLKIVLFMNMPIFIMLFSGLRQSLAMAFTMIAYEFVKKKKFFPFVITSLIAMEFHHSAFIIFALYPLYYMRLRKKHLFLLLPIVGLVFVFNRQIFSVLTTFTTSIWGEEYDVVASYIINAYDYIILFALFVLMAYLITDERTVFGEVLGLRNYLLFTLLLQCFAPIHTLAMRMNYYFIMFLPMAISQTLNCASVKNKKIAQLAEYIIVIYFVYYYISHAYQACITDGMSLGVYPYKLFF